MVTKAATYTVEIGIGHRTLDATTYERRSDALVRAYQILRNQSHYLPRFDWVQVTRQGVGVVFHAGHHPA